MWVLASRKGGPGGPAPSLLPLARADDSVAGTQLRSHPRRARAPAPELIPQRPVLPKPQGDSSPRTLPSGARVTLPTPGFGPQRFPVLEPHWDKSRPPAQEPRTSGAVSPGPHGAAGRQHQWQLRERCVRLCGGLGRALRFSPSPTPPSPPPPPPLLGSQCWEGGSQRHISTGFPNCPEVPGLAEMSPPQWQLQGTEAREEGKQSALGQVACEGVGWRVVLTLCRLARHLPTFLSTT